MLEVEQSGTEITCRPAYTELGRLISGISDILLCFIFMDETEESLVSSLVETYLLLLLL